MKGAELAARAVRYGAGQRCYRACRHRRGGFARCPLPARRVVACAGICLSSPRPERSRCCPRSRVAVSVFVPARSVRQHLDDRARFRSAATGQFADDRGGVSCSSVLAPLLPRAWRFSSLASMRPQCMPSAHLVEGHRLGGRRHECSARFPTLADGVYPVVDLFAQIACAPCVVHPRSVTSGYPPRPMSRRLPAIEQRSIQLRAPVTLTSSARPATSPTKFMPGVVSRCTSIGDSALTFRRPRFRTAGAMSPCASLDATVLDCRSIMSPIKKDELVCSVMIRCESSDMPVSLAGEGFMTLHDTV
jgi:hypothetical protein